MTGSDKKTDISRHAAPVPDASEPFISVRSVRPVLDYVEEHGRRSADLLRTAGIDHAVLDDAEGRIPHGKALALWEAAGQLAGDRNIGLHVGEAIRPGTFGALEYAVLTSSRLGDGLERLVRYHRVLHDAAQVSLERQGDVAVLAHRLPVPGGAPRPVADYVLAGWLSMLRRITGMGFRLTAVCFPYPMPADRSAHQRIFSAPLRFEHHRSELRFPAELLERALVGADPVLQPIVESRIATLLEALPSSGGYVARVRRALLDELCDGEPVLERVARKLHMSPRTLHRRLAAEGTGFRQLVTTLRRELAEHHLNDPGLSVAQVAFLLGYSEPSAFHRAFKRWTGSSPDAFRESRR
ncbi:MAG: AraC family transcriptional regulator [Ectothiorhodospiraceae bacterium]|nr:AraC family transcriptional regulator [Ectothiorhodospiraceae bacterium]